MSAIKGNLKSLVKRFLNGNKNTYVDGDWRISQGGYDCWFEIYLNDIAVITCIAGKLSGNEEILGKEQLEKCFNIIKEAYGGDRITIK